MGAKPGVAHQMAVNSRRWWRNIGMLLNAVLTWRGPTSWAYPVSHDLTFSNRPARTRMPDGLAGAAYQGRPVCRLANQSFPSMGAGLGVCPPR